MPFYPIHAKAWFLQEHSWMLISCKICIMNIILFNICFRTLCIIAIFDFCDAEAAPNSSLRKEVWDTVPQPGRLPATSLDTALFNHMQRHLVHDKPSKQWPVKVAYPLPGAILPF